MGFPHPVAECHVARYPLSRSLVTNFSPSFARAALGKTEQLQLERRARAADASSCISSSSTAQILLKLAHALPSHAPHPMESSPLPLVNSLDEIYTPAALVHEGERWNAVFEKFQHEYGTPVQKVSRAPGRVNIIGEQRRDESNQNFHFTSGDYGITRALMLTMSNMQANTSTTAGSASCPPPSSATS